MADDGAQRFEDTMDVLEARREETEARFRDLSAQLSAHVSALGEATGRAAELYGPVVGAGRRAAAAAEGGSVGTTGDGAEPVPLTWPQRTTGWRGILDRLAHWLMRDHLEVLDRRHDAHQRRVAELEGRVADLHGTVRAEAEAGAVLSDALGKAQQALQAALATHNEMLALVNAKDAEVLQRAVAGPLRRMEVIFDEFGRQQEALLAQLVGRRRELDEIVRIVTPTPKEEM
jgi:hypothetical protein